MENKDENFISDDDIRFLNDVYKFISDITSFEEKIKKEELEKVNNFIYDNLSKFDFDTLIDYACEKFSCDKMFISKSLCKDIKLPTNDLLSYLSLCKLKLFSALKNKEFNFGVELKNINSDETVNL